MGNPENQPNIEELTEEAAKMVEGNKKLAETTKSGGEFGSGYNAERKLTMQAKDDLASTIEDYKSAIELNIERLKDLPVGPESKRLLEKNAEMQDKLREKEKSYAAVNEQYLSQSEKHRGFQAEQELIAKHPEDFAAETVATGDLETEVSLRTKIPGKIREREKTQKEAVEKNKAAEFLKKDQETLASVQEQFEKLQAKIEAKIQELITMAQSSESQTKVANTISEIEKLRSAFFKKEEKRAQAENLERDLKNWFRNNFSDPVIKLGYEALDFSNHNSDRYRYGDQEKVPTLNTVYTGFYTQFPEEAEEVQMRKETLFKQIDEYERNLRQTRNSEITNQLYTILQLNKLEKED